MQNSVLIVKICFYSKHQPSWFANTIPLNEATEMFISLSTYVMQFWYILRLFVRLPYMWDFQPLSTK